MKMKKNKGFALLYAILLSGSMLLIGILLMDIITKQLVFSSLNRDSDAVYYYLANSGRECLINAINDGQFIDRTPDGFTRTVKAGPVSIDCFGLSNVDLEPVTNDTFLAQNIDVDGKKVDLQVQVNGSCIDGGVCGGSGLIENYHYVATASGYGAGSTLGGRTVKRTVIFVLK